MKTSHQYKIPMHSWLKLEKKAKELSKLANRLITANDVAYAAIETKSKDISLKTINQAILDRKSKNLMLKNQSK